MFLLYTHIKKLFTNKKTKKGLFFITLCGILTLSTSILLLVDYYK